jgi:hypothetical protein
MEQILGSAVSSKVAKSAHSKTLTRPGEFGKQKLRFKRPQNNLSQLTDRTYWSFR